jgi:serine/threonine protein kinase
VPAATPELLRGLNRPSRLRRLDDVFRQVCSGLAYLHSQGLVHRDLKPSNIMVDDSRCARIMDFGLVKPIGDAPSLTMAGRVVGTYRYMAPEQARGYPVDGRADLYSLGVILFELLCGRPPYFARSASEVWHEIVEQPPPSVRSLNPGADARLAGAAERLLRKHPAERFQTAEELLAELDRNASGRSDILDD